MPSRLHAPTGISVFLALGLALALTLALAGCGGGGGGEGRASQGGGNPLEQPPVGDPSEAPAIAFTIPAHATLEVARELPIQVQFSVSLDPTSVQPDSIVVEGNQGPVPGEARLISTDLVLFFPDEDLPYGDTYRVTLQPGIRSTAGEERLGTYTFAFRAREAMPDLGASPHEFDPVHVGLMALDVNAAGDGLSVMGQFDAASRTMRFRRIRNGVPTGPVEDLFPAATAAGGNQDGPDVAANGNAQCVWEQDEVQGQVVRRTVFVRQFDRISDSWGSTLELTPGPGLKARAVTSEMNDNGGLVAWVESDEGDDDNHRVLAGRYSESGLNDVSLLGSPTRFKRSLLLSRRGVAGVIAFDAGVPGSTSSRGQVQAGRFTEAFGFDAVQSIDGTNIGRVRAAEASPTGHLYVLFEREDPSDTSLGRWHLAVSNPGQPFGTPLPLHADIVKVASAAMAVGDNGVLTMIYGVQGANAGVWARRYTPGIGLSAAAEITGEGFRFAKGGTAQPSVRADAKGNAVAAVAVFSGNGQAIRAALLPVDKPWTLGIEIVDEPDASPASAEVRVVLEPSGGMLVAWIARIAVSPALEVIRIARVRTDGARGSVTTVTSGPAASLGPPRLAMTREGRGLLLFTTPGSLAGGTGPAKVLQISID